VGNDETRAGQLDGLELHLKEAPKNADERRHRRANEHLDAAAGVDGIEAFYGISTVAAASPLNEFKGKLKRIERRSRSRTTT
jgi:hypothetical protein